MHAVVLPVLNPGKEENAFRIFLVTQYANDEPGISEKSSGATW